MRILPLLYVEVTILLKQSPVKRDQATEKNVLTKKMITLQMYDFCTFTSCFGVVVPTEIHNLCHF